jgi:hypothetical protein
VKLVLDAGSNRVWHLPVGDSALQSVANPNSSLQIAGAHFTILKVMHHLAGSFHQKLIAKIRIELLTYPLASLGIKTEGVHAVSAAPACFVCGLIPYERATSANSCRSSFLPRLNLDITVPNGILKVSAISL